MCITAKTWLQREIVGLAFLNGVKTKKLAQLRFKSRSAWHQLLHSAASHNTTPPKVCFSLSTPCVALGTVTFIWRTWPSACMIRTEWEFTRLPAFSVKEKSSMMERMWPLALDESRFASWLLHSVTLVKSPNVSESSFSHLQHGSPPLSDEDWSPAESLVRVGVFPCGCPLIVEEPLRSSSPHSSEAAVRQSLVIRSAL